MKKNIFLKFGILTFLVITGIFLVLSSTNNKILSNTKSLVKSGFCEIVNLTKIKNAQAYTVCGINYNVSGYSQCTCGTNVCVTCNPGWCCTCATNGAPICQICGGGGGGGGTDSCSVSVGVNDDGSQQYWSEFNKYIAGNVSIHFQASEGANCFRDDSNWAANSTGNYIGASGYQSEYVPVSTTRDYTYKMTCYKGSALCSGSATVHAIAPSTYCGDGTCNGLETCSSCPAECGTCAPVCGDGACNGSENCSSCPGDCGACPPVCTSTLNAWATPTSIVSGGCSLLSWTGTNLSTVTLWDSSASGVPGTRSVCPTATTNYNIFATAASGCTLATPTVTATVTVVPKPPTVTLTANPSSIINGNSSTLSWTSSGATSLTINQNVGTVTPVASGSKPVSPTTTTTYTITAAGPGGSTTASATVTVTYPGPTIGLIADPSVIKKGKCSTLNWTSTNATSLTLDNGIGKVAVPSGSKEVCPTDTTTYTITATGPGGTNTAKTTVTVDPCGAACTSETAEGILKFDQAKNQYYILIDDKSTVVLMEDPCIHINFKDYLDTRVKVTGCHESDNRLRVLSIEKISTPAPIPAPLANLSQLIATGGTLWVNIAIAVILSGIIGYFILRKKEQI